MTAPAPSVLIVEDNRQAGELLATCLGSEGFTVSVCRDGPCGVARAAEDTFDVVLLDIGLPGTDGLVTLRQMRERHPATELPIIMATARDDSETVVRALGLGANDYVTKPYDLPVLLARVRTQVTLRRMVRQLVELERNLEQRNEELCAANRRLTEAFRATKRDLVAAARVQESLLPQSVPDVPGVRAAWASRPCEELAGDTLNFFPLGPDTLGLYVLDVSGHGVAAALLSVQLSRVLMPTRDAPTWKSGSPAGDGRRPAPVADVAAALDRRFPFDPDAAGQFFTLAYGALDRNTGELRYVLAGHPGPVFWPHGGKPRILDGTSGPPIGLGFGGYEEQSVRLAPGDRIYFYSDGLPDARGPDGLPFRHERMLGSLTARPGATLEASVLGLVDDVLRWGSTPRPRDDVSVLALEFTGTVAAPAPTRSIPAAIGTGRPTGDEG